MPKKRNFTNALVLNPNEHELNTVKNGLNEFYKNNPQFLKNGKSIEDKIGEVIEECKVGWICAPRGFIKRVEWKTKWNSAALKNRLDYVDNYHNAEQIAIQKELTDKKKTKELYPGVSAKSLRDVLSVDEKKFWQEREAYYRQEFEFNNSADWSLLMQLLLEELTQYRLSRRRMQNPDDDLDFQLTSSNKRLLDAQKALGITREQRENASNETEGNVAQLSMLYEEKIRLIEKLEKKDRLEEEAMQIRHDNKDWPDTIPRDVLDAMSKADDDYEDFNISLEIDKEKNKKLEIEEDNGQNTT